MLPSCPWGPCSRVLVVGSCPLGSGCAPLACRVLGLVCHCCPSKDRGEGDGSGDIAGVHLRRWRTWGWGAPEEMGGSVGVWVLVMLGASAAPAPGLHLAEPLPIREEKKPQSETPLLLGTEAVPGLEPPHCREGRQQLDGEQDWVAPKAVVTSSVAPFPPSSSKRPCCGSGLGLRAASAPHRGGDDLDSLLIYECKIRPQIQLFLLLALFFNESASHLSC